MAVPKEAISDGSCPMESVDPNETDVSGDEGIKTPNAFERKVDQNEAGECTSSKKRKKRASSDEVDLGDAFIQVRALKWRQEWMRSQIELLSLQRDLLVNALNKARAEKCQCTLHLPTKRGHQSTSSGPSNGITSQGHATEKTNHCEECDIRNNGGEFAETSWGCVRAVDWKQTLGGRRRKLVQAAMPVSVLQREAQEQEARRRHRSVVGLTLSKGSIGFRADNSKLQERDSSGRFTGHAKDLSQNTNVGRKLVTSTGQKVVIKLSGKSTSPKSPAPSNGKNGKTASASRSDGDPHTPCSTKKNKSIAALTGQRSAASSPRLGPSSMPNTPRESSTTRDWGIDDYVYGGPRVQTKIEIVKAKEIEIPNWRVISQRKEVVYQRSRSMSVGSKYAKPRMQTSPSNGASNDGGHNESSEEITDDEVYSRRHRPYEEQEIKFRYPKQQERQQKHRDSLQKEGGNLDRVEEAYRNLWYRPSSSSNFDEENTTVSRRKGSGIQSSSGDERSPRTDTSSHSMTKVGRKCQGKRGSPGHKIPSRDGDWKDSPSGEGVGVA
uniref:Uncharacterized protein n=1 Tax=Hanusia phi TaxID=3032 RepID=A0A7S0HFA9_9CRYP|mmetsp:Transcript_19125/g.43867  ORF Transcript_19125/g.43867 Transcript_19125/m.43867 type:complete len:552 (+) Transcript_19125:554-2209(+)